MSDTCTSVLDSNGLRCEAIPGHHPHELHMHKTEATPTERVTVYLWADKDSRDYMDRERAFWDWIDSIVKTPTHYTPTALASAVLQLNERIDR